MYQADPSRTKLSSPLLPQPPLRGPPRNIGVRWVRFQGFSEGDTGSELPALQPTGPARSSHPMHHFHLMTDAFGSLGVWWSTAHGSSSLRATRAQQHPRSCFSQLWGKVGQFRVLEPDMSLLLGVAVSARVSFLPRGTSQATRSATSSDPNCRGTGITAWTPQLRPPSSGLPWKLAAYVMFGERVRKASQVSGTNVTVLPCERWEVVMN